jgi:hypothetical protein
MIGSCASPSEWLNRVTIRLRSCSLISSTVKLPSVPTTVLMNFPASFTLNAYVPNARRNTGPYCGSSIITGFFVPHFWSVTRVVRTK